MFYICNLYTLNFFSGGGGNLGKFVLVIHNKSGSVKQAARQRNKHNSACGVCMFLCRLVSYYPSCHGSFAGILHSNSHTVHKRLFSIHLLFPETLKL